MSVLPSAAARLGESVRVVDVSAIVGRNVAGPAVAWQTRDGELLVEHVAAPGPDGSLQVFYYSPRDDWQVVDVSAITGRRVSGPVTAWVTRAGATAVEHVAATDARGDVLVFFFTPRRGWQVVDVSAITGRGVTGGLTSWVTGRREHLAGVSDTGELLVFTYTSDIDWRVDTIPAGGRRLTGPVTDWRSRSGGRVIEHLAARTTSGEVVTWYRPPGERWRLVDLTAAAGQRIAGPLVAWTVDSVERLAGRRADGSIVELTYSPRRDWAARNLTTVTGERIAGGAAAAMLREDGALVQLLSARGRRGALLHLWRAGTSEWESLNLSDVTGRTVAHDPISWVTPDGDRVVEHVAAADDHGALLVFVVDGELRRLTDRVRRPFQSLRARPRTRRRLLTILLDPHRPDHPAPSRAAVEAALFGERDSVRHYLLEVSGGRFTIENAGILGWYDTEHPADYYWAAGPDREGGWQNRHHRRYREAVEHAARDHRFAADDARPDDGRLDPDELGILIVTPARPGSSGYHRPVVARELPQSEALRIGSVAFTEVVEWFTGDPINIGVAAHELCHLLLRHTDMYFDLPDTRTWRGVPWDNPFAAGTYSLMDQAGNAPHLDGFSKLKLGWAHPRLIARAGRHTLPAVETSQLVWILMDPAHATDEYFLVENRWPGTSYDRALPDSGLAVWHIIEDPDIYTTTIPPRPPDAPATSQQDRWAEKWATIDATGWGRRAIRMIRPVWSTFDDGQALWDGADPRTGYDLLGRAVTNRTRATLRWADGTPSGFSVRDISPAGRTMHATIEVPWSA